MKRQYEIKLHDEGAHSGYHVITIDGKYASRYRREEDAKKYVECRKVFDRN